MLALQTLTSVGRRTADFEAGNGSCAAMQRPAGMKAFRRARTVRPLALHSYRAGNWYAHEEFVACEWFNV